MKEFCILELPPNEKDGHVHSGKCMADSVRCFCYGTKAILRAVTDRELLDEVWDRLWEAQAETCTDILELSYTIGKEAQGSERRNLTASDLEDSDDRPECPICHRTDSHSHDGDTLQ